MNKISINNFIRGLNKDTDKSIVSKDSYLDAYNFRIVTSEGSSTGALENIKGNSSIGNVVPAGQFVCGSTRLRDDIVLFTTTNTGEPVHGVGRSMIHLVTLDRPTETSATFTTIYDDNLNAGLGADTLDFSIIYPIKCISKYETSNIQKVYWTDGLNNTRYANIAANLTITGAAYASSGEYMSTDKFEFLPAFTPSIPQLNAMVGGKLTGGVVQYAYQLYRLNGAETAFSPVSAMIHIVADSDFKTDTRQYEGDKESGKETGKGCKLSIVVNDSGYNRLRLIRIHYDALNSVPLIHIASEIEISTSPSTVYITDVGDNVSSLTIEEFDLTSTELFSCEDLAIKDNRLFAANIDNKEFTIDDFDVRAVRFKAASTATVYDGEAPLAILANLSNWSSYTSDHDGINKFNDPTHDGDSAYQWMYQADGATIGAEGYNIKIDFATDPVVIDNSGNVTTFYTTGGASGGDNSYKSYASPWKGNKLSWQRDETYRLFCVWGNDRGQTTPPYWMIDLKMPSLHDADFTNSSSATVYPSRLAYQSGSTISTYRLYPRIYFKNWPADASYCQIYRVKRERADRSVVTQGFAVPCQNLDSAYRPTETYAVLPNNGELFKMVSPEINITKNIVKQSGDYLEYVTNFSTGTTETEVKFGSTGYVMGHIDKMEYNTRVDFATACVTAIDEALPVAPSTTVDSDLITIDSKQFCNYDSAEAIKAKGCTGLVVAYHDATWSAETVKNAIINYRCNVYGSQYGGHTYEDRSSNISIACSGIITHANEDTWIDIPYGDTFINYFDVSTMLADLTQDHYYQTWSETVYVPLESSINCDLRYDIESAHHYTIPQSYDGYIPFLRQEYNGDHTMDIHGSNRTFNQTLDLYLYNTVYSQQPTVQLALSEMIDTPNETDFDCAIKASNIKYNGELSDSWTKFGVNEEIEVDSNYGAIQAIKVFNDKLYFWQDDAFGVLSVNERLLIQDGDTSKLVLGTGGILDRFDYLSNSIGTSDTRSVINSDSGIYWFYDKDKSIYRFNGKIEDLTKVKNVSSWFRNNYNDDYTVHGIYDRLYNDIIYTLYKQSDGSGYSLAFNEQTDQFTSFYDFVPRLYVDCKDVYLTPLDDTNTVLFWHNSDIAPRCQFYGTTYDSTIKMLCNDEYATTKVFDNIFYVSNAFDETTDVEQYSTTFNQFRCYNDYQNTNWVDLTYPTNVMRRERGWTIAIPRNLVDHNYNTSPDIFTDLAVTKDWAERIRDKYMVLDLVFDNTSDTRFVVPFVGIKYRVSYR